MYADDTLVIAKSALDLEKKINILKKELKKIGLTLNDDKLNIMLYGNKDKHQIAGINTVRSIKYLGIDFHDSKNPLKNNVMSRIDKAKNIKDGLCIC